MTVTQNLLFQFRLLSLAFPNAVEMSEAIDEKANGNDIELFIKIGHGYAFLPCQAKIASKTGKTGLYNSIDHVVGDKKSKVIKHQIDSLLEYANHAPLNIDGKRIEMTIPIYLFYNFSANARTISSITASTTDEIEVYGCTYVDARKLKGKTYYNSGKWIKKPSFSSLHIAKPFYKIFNLVGRSMIDVYQEVIDSSATKDQAAGGSLFIQFNTDNRPEVDERYSKGWIPISGELPNSQDRVDTDRGSTRNDDTAGGFNPKYRIVFNDSELDASIAKWLFM